MAYVAYTDIGGMALIVNGNPGAETELKIVWLDELTETAVLEMATEYWQSYGLRLSREPRDRQRWPETLNSTTRRLWDLVIGPVLSALPTSDRVVLIPGGMLGLLPLQAAWREDQFAVTGRRYALDAALITYTPSARALQRTGPRTAPTEQSGILAVYDPDPGLPNTPLEVREALSWFGRGRQLSKDHATLDMVCAELAEYSVLHFSCHGSAHLEESSAERAESCQRWLADAGSSS